MAHLPHVIEDYPVYNEDAEEPTKKETKKGS
jgi:hypothetical protein